MKAYKVIARDKKTGVQWKKKEYIGYDKFKKYSNEIIERWSWLGYGIEVYEMIDDNWVLLKNIL